MGDRAGERDCRRPWQQADRSGGAALTARERLKRLSWRGFHAFDRVGLHVLPKHYYTPVADRARLRAHPERWRKPISFDWDLDAQLEWLRRVCPPYLAEVAGFDAYRRLVDEGFGPGYGPVEAQVLHCVVRSCAPRRIVEIGGGVTTAIMAAAARENEAEGRPAARITTIEPSPWGQLPTLAGVELIRQGVQDAPTELFAELGDGDLLFIDSSHAVKTGSEVPYVYLELVPRLAGGVLVHVHDIYLPFLYSPFLFQDYFDPQESALLAALLRGNESLEVLCCESALHHARPTELQAILPDYRPQALPNGLAWGPLEGHFPSSLWARTRPGPG